MTIAVGDTLPAATLARLTAYGPEQIETAEFFKGRRIALFSVPGAFTPTCSARHLPGFVEKADALKAKGIDEVVGTAVNDAFVMSAWGKAQGAEDKVTLLADGNAAFVKALGLDFDGSQFGMGTRGQRFSMVVNDNKVEKLFVEKGGEFHVSSAEHMLAEL
jgi:glutaredoxin/glutathione-dependent peroxiredoxin